MAIVGRLDDRLSARLDALRALLALLVVLDHAALLRLIAPAWGAPGVAAHAARIVTGQGHSAVMGFFVLSGFLVGGSALAAARRDGDLDLRRYASDRATRLYLVLLPALALGFVLDAVGRWCLPAWYHANPLIAGDVAPRLGAWPLAANCLFLQGVCAPPFGSNGALWSLGNEAWYYLAWPLLLAPWLRRRSTRGRLALAAAGAAVLAIMVVVPPLERWRAPYGYDFPTRVAWYLPLWLLGVAVRAAPRRWAPPAWTGLIAVLAGVVARDRYEYRQWFGNGTVVAWDWLQAGSVAFLIWSWLRPTAGTPGWAGFARAAAGCSFSLYALHLPMLVLIAGAASYWSGVAATRQEPPQRWWVGAVAIASALIYAWAVAALTERRTDSVRRWLRTRGEPKAVATFTSSV